MTSWLIELLLVIIVIAIVVKLLPWIIIKIALIALAVIWGLITVGFFIVWFGSDTDDQGGVAK